MTTTQHSITAPPGEDLLPWRDPEFVKAPWPWFARVREEYPILQLENGTIVITRYDDVVEHLKDPSLVAVPPEGIGDSPWASNLNSVLLTEGETHSRIHKSFRKWLTPKATKGMGEVAAESARAALDRMGPDGIINAHRDLGVQPAQDAMAAALGVPREDGIPYIVATNQTMDSLGWEPTADEKTRAWEGFGFMMFNADRLIQEKRRNPGDGLLDAMIKITDEGGLTERELKESIQILWGSAAHNPGYCMASALADLAAYPEAWKEYRENPDARTAIINEAFRRALPEVLVDRYTTEPYEILGVTIPPNTQVRFILGAAVRDPEVFRNPDGFDWTRPPAASMAIAFGAGTHSCCGQGVARVEMRAVLDVLAERAEKIEVIGEPQWVFSDRHRNCEGLTVRLS
ncbi:cytochrome P450 [Arthrobacter sp. I2-34]|uniref:Cytochrome P450 n=1 Tax=Arthrobacter hankyongi TaxID=2904801 RepID=A0ABS9L5U6_9MICC|nr:cytochrome P450 [Arthrobacter hankyongi]MCG2621847.1 cytochrome P450 [Arthrobacter hankyongi]